MSTVPRTKKPLAESKGKRAWIDLNGDETPAIGRRRSSLVVRMSLHVRSELLRLAEEADDGNETGGFVFGRPSLYGSNRSVLEVTSAIRAATVRRPLIADFRLPGPPALADHLDGLGGRQRLIGDWHTHPEGPNPGRASHEDRVCWLGHLDLSGRTRIHD